MHLSHDPAFKRLFAYPELVRALLALVPECPTGTEIVLERVNCSFVSSTDRQRYADMVWRVVSPLMQFYVLVEFQASIDRLMMQRMKVYSGLLSQDLGAQHKRELLDLLPVVVYSGHRKWPNAVRAKASWLRSYQEGKVYFLVDEEVAGDSVIGDVIRLVRGDSLAEIVASVSALLSWPLASAGLKIEVCSIAAERVAIHGSSLEEIMEDVAMEGAPAALTLEEKKLLFEMFQTIYMTLKDTPEFKRMDEARSDARRQGQEEGLQKGRQEGRVDAMRALLAKACERAGLVQPELMGIIANADAIQLEGWADRWMSGEKLEEMFA